MKNIATCRSDGMNVYINLKVIPNLKGIWLLVILVTIILLVFSFALINYKVKDNTTIALPLLILVILLWYFPIRYLLWNIYGQEDIIVNTKTISNSYNYGIVKTNLSTYRFNILGTGFEKVRISRDEKELGRLIFYDYSIETNLPNQIMETSVLIPLDILREIDDLIKELFYIEERLHANFIPFSQN